jgi:hypothetical protein
VKTEAQELAKLLRASVGEETLVPKKPPEKKRTPATATASTSQPKSASSSNDPFDALK